MISMNYTIKIYSYTHLTEDKTMAEEAKKVAEKAPAKKAPATKKTTAKKAAPAKKVAAAKKPAAKKTTTKAAKTPAKKAVAKKPAAKKVAAKKAPAKKAAPKKLGKVIFEFDGQQIDYKKIEKKAAKLGGDVYVVANEKKIFDKDGKSVDIF